MRGRFFRVLPALGILALFLISGCLSAGSQTDTVAPTQSAISIKQGEAVFTSNCRICHGPDGKGVSGTGASDLTSSQVKALTREQQIDQVTNGGIAMPPFEKALTEEDIEAVVSYIGTL